jgi:redox-sensitive bicupin YhaK (pirin superfamily)
VSTTILQPSTLLSSAVPSSAVPSSAVPSSAVPSTPVGESAPRGPAREVSGVHTAPDLHWVGDGFRVAGYFSGIPDAVRRLDPFLMLDYHPEYVYAPSPRPRGVGVHPHRGFETVTIAFQGKVAHHDSAGGGGVIGPGDVQWMTAGAGVLHKEYHEAEFSRQGGAFQMAQLWVNLPKAHKMTPPRYQPIVAEQIAVATLPADAGTVRVIAGEYRGVRGPAKTFTKIDIYETRLNPGGEVEFSIPARDNVAILVMQGDVTINDVQPATTGDFVLFANRGESIVVRASDSAQLLVLSGEPIGEPVVQYGPFVMNTAREIHEAILDLNSGKFGFLDD